MSSFSVELWTSLRETRTRFDRFRQQADDAKGAVVRLETELAEIDARAEILRQARVVLKEAFDYLVGAVEGDLNVLVNAAVSDIFPDRQDRFSAKFVGRADKMVLELEMVRGDDKAIPILGGRGGGLVNVVEVALRIVAVCLSNSRRVLILDQPFSDLSEDRHQVCGEFLSQVCKDLGIQLISVSHQREFHGCADHLVELTLSKEQITKILRVVGEVVVARERL